MRTIGNILWFIFGGLLGGLAWIFAGCIWCITIIGIPVGLQCFKFASLAFWPFGKEIVYENSYLLPSDLKALLSFVSVRIFPLICKKFFKNEQ